MCRLLIFCSEATDANYTRILSLKVSHTATPGTSRVGSVSSSIIVSNSRRSRAESLPPGKAFAAWSRVELFPSSFQFWYPRGHLGSLITLWDPQMQPRSCPLLELTPSFPQSSLISHFRPDLECCFL